MKHINLGAIAILALMFEGACQPCVGADPVPAYIDGCVDGLEEGGLAGWFAVQCDEPFTDIADEAEWDAKILAETVFGRFDGDFIRGSLPASERAKVSVGACGAEKTISKTYTATLIDSAYESTNTKFDLYDFIDKQSKRYLFGFIQCDGTVYGPFENVTAEVDEIIPETVNESKSIQIVFTWKTGLGVPKPTSLPFLVGKQLHV